MGPVQPSWTDAPTPHHEAPSHSFVAPLSQPLNAAHLDDSDEWEYEYSTTETETFYLTLDLTTTSIPTSRPRVPIPRNGRAGFKAKWINPGLGRHKRQLGRAPTYSLADKDGEGPNPADSADEDAPGSPDEAALQAEDDTEDSERPEKIQILNLESDNLLISYRDHVFTCQWAKNIGTELLFAVHEEDSDNPLPTLRHLPAGVDLLGACSARITSNTATLVPVTRNAPLDAPQDEDGPLVESVSVAASDDRRKQARFLERLMKLKDRKSEDDEVTVVAYKRLRFQGWVDQIRKKREEERAVLRQKLWNSTRQEAEEAQRRLTELDEQERTMPKEAPVQYDDDEEEEAGGRPAKKKRKKRKEMLAEPGEEGPPKEKPRAIRRRPRGDWKRYNLDGTIAASKPAAAAVNWHGAHTTESPTGGWNGWNGNDLVDEDAEGEVDDTLVHDAGGVAGQAQDDFVEAHVENMAGEEHMPVQGPSVAPDELAPMQHLAAPDHMTAPELLAPPGGWMGLLEGDDIGRLSEAE